MPRAYVCLKDLTNGGDIDHEQLQDSDALFRIPEIQWWLDRARRARDQYHREYPDEPIEVGLAIVVSLESE